jgi:hypothetical protein
LPRALCIAEVRTAAGAAAATACRLSVMAAGLVAASRTTGVVTGVATTAVELEAGRAGAAAGGAGTVAKRAAAAADPATTAARRVSADRRDTGLVGTASSFVSTAGPTLAPKEPGGGRRRTRSYTQTVTPCPSLRMSGGTSGPPPDYESISLIYNDADNRTVYFLW